MDRRFLQFPLCALSFGRDINECLNCIIAIGIVEMGVKEWETFSPEQRIARHVGALADPGARPAGLWT